MPPRHTRSRPQRHTDEREAFLEMLDRYPDSVSGAGRPREDRRMIADRLFDASCDCRDEVMAIAYALRAVRLNPACLDARVLLAIAAGGPPGEFIEELQTIVAVGESDLGPAFFKQNRGEFWGLMETRPYMRARHHLALELYKVGSVAEAISHYEEMLQLNPGDNQGLRYWLLGHYLEIDDLDGARRLLKVYGDEPFAMFLWARVLERYLSGDLMEQLRLYSRLAGRILMLSHFWLEKPSSPKTAQTITGLATLQKP